MLLCPRFYVQHLLKGLTFAVSKHKRVAHLAADFSIFISQDLRVIPPLAYKVEAAYDVGIVPIASLNSALQMHMHRQNDDVAVVLLLPILH